MKQYKAYITANINSKGVLDIDTVKGCRIGMEVYPDGGCYGLCYAAKIAKLYKYDFTKSVSRLIEEPSPQLNLFGGMFFGGNVGVYNTTRKHKMGWFRVGTMGDPSHDWELTNDLCCWLGKVKIPVIVTKHWLELPGFMLPKLKSAGVVINTSISALDTKEEISYRIGQFKRFMRYGIKSVLRVVSCEFGKTDKGKKLNSIQNKIFNTGETIDTPLRIPATDKRVVCGDIVVDKIKGLNSYHCVSCINKDTHLGVCSVCPDRCGTAFD